jgi:Carboxypeptidase regulatory-like domain
MTNYRFRECLASVLVAAVAATTAPVFAAPAPATLQGTVIAAAATPMVGVLVVVKDVDGTRLAAAKTAADGSFKVDAVPAGVRTIGVETPEGAFDVATPITLAPGEIKGVQLAVRQAKDDDDDDKKAAAGGPSGGAMAAMIVTIVGFAVMGGLAIDSMGDDDPTTVPASPSNPD